MLVQARTGKIGLAKFLYNCRVPGFEIAQYRCEAGYKTPRHIAMYCAKEADCRDQLIDLTGRRWSYLQLIGAGEAVKGFTQWKMCSGRLG